MRPRTHSNSASSSCQRSLTRTPSVGEQSRDDPPWALSHSSRASGECGALGTNGAPSAFASTPVVDSKMADRDAIRQGFTR
jgi:hypothetical protein